MLNPLIRLLQKLPWPLRNKLAACFSLILLGFILNSLLSFWLLATIQTAEENQKSSSLYLERLARYELAYDSEQNVFSDAIFYTKVPFVRDNFKNTILEGMTESYKQTLNSNQSDFEQQFARLYTVAYDKFNQLDTDIRQQNFEQAANDWHNAQPDLLKISQLIDQRTKQLEADRDTSQKALQDTLFISNLLLAIFLALSLAMAVLLLWVLDRVLVHPLNRLQKALQEVAKGDLDQNLVLANQDEVGRLAQSFQQAVVVLQQMIRGVQISQDLQDLGNQLADLSEQQAAGSSEQVGALAQITAAIQELGSTASLIAASAVQVASLSNNTLLTQINEVATAGHNSLETTEQVVGVVENTLVRTELVGQQVEHLHYQMAQLSVQAQSIDKVVMLLNQLAGEVRMVSLNASIEAASAGEYGERFKKVAREIKELANRTNQAAEQARDLISGVQESAQNTLTEMQNSQSQLLNVIQSNQQLRPGLQALNQSAHRVQEMVNILLSVAAQVNEQSQQIKQATSQQRISSEQVLLSAQSLSSIANQNESASRQLATNSTRLERLTHQLGQVLGQVRLGV